SRQIGDAALRQRLEGVGCGAAGCRWLLILGIGHGVSLAPRTGRAKDLVRNGRRSAAGDAELPALEGAEEIPLELDLERDRQGGGPGSRQRTRPAGLRPAGA